MKKQHSIYGFTLIEIIIVIGVISILAGIVITAVNPRRQLAITENTKRAAAARELQNAIQQFVIDDKMLPGIPFDGDEVVTYEICREGGGNGCHDLTPLVTFGYLTAIPVDILAEAPLSGFRVTYRPSGHIAVESEHIEDATPDDDDEGCPTESIEFPAGEGFLEPYQITNCSQLQQMYGDSSYVLTRDIDCSATNPNHVCHASSIWADGGGVEGEGFIPLIPTLHLSFDGQGHSIRNLYSNRPTLGSALFYRLTGPSVDCCNVSLENVDIIGGRGALTNWLDHAEISDIRVTGSVQGAWRTGGVIGTAEDAAVRRASLAGTVTSTSDVVGGLIGELRDAITVEDCFVTGAVTGISDVGGLYGISLDEEQQVRRCYNAATVHASGMNFPIAGGMLGQTSTSTYGFPAITVENSFNVGEVSLAIAGFAGGITGAGGITPATNVYWFNFMGGPAHECGGTTSVDCIEVASPDVFYGTDGADHTVYATWDFQNIWQENSGALPTLR